MRGVANINGKTVTKDTFRDDRNVGELGDSELVAAHLGGNGRAFSELVDRYQGRLRAYVVRKIGDPVRAEDIVQEAFLRVHRHLNRFDQDRKFSSWVYTITANLTKNELRRRSRSPLVLFQALTPNTDRNDRPLEFEDESFIPDRLYRQRRLRRLVEGTVERLPDTHRSVFVLREMEGKTYEEIATLTGIKVGTVKSRLHRARQRFAELIEPLLD
jgi:RNA polymerase sigma-70 factor (ECF subfamily)